jgi:hypothetical protein
VNLVTIQREANMTRSKSESVFSWLSLRRRRGARGDQDASLLVVGGASVGELFQRDALDLDALAVPGIAPADHLVNEAAIGRRR